MDIIMEERLHHVKIDNLINYLFENNWEIGRAHV